MAEEREVRKQDEMAEAGVRLQDDDTTYKGLWGLFILISFKKYT